MCLKQDFIPITKLVIVAPILKVVTNLFQSFNLHVDSSIWFRYQMIVCNLKTVCCLLPSDLPAKIQPAITNLVPRVSHLTALSSLD